MEPTASQNYLLKTRLAILTAVLFSGMSITVAIILAFSYIVNPQISESDIHFILTTGIIDFFVCCPIYYYFGFKTSASSQLKESSNLKFPYRVVHNVPTEVSVTLCMKWLALTIMFAFIGIMCGMLFIFIYRLTDSQLSRSEYLAPFLNGTLVAYCSGGISWYAGRKKRNDNATPFRLRHLLDKKSVILTLICIWIILFTMSILSILLDTHGIILNIIIAICLCLGIVIAITLMNALAANSKLHLEIQDNSQLIGQLKEKNAEIEDLNKNLQNQKATLFKKGRETINRLCGEYSDKWESDKTRPYLLNTLKEEVAKLRSWQYKKSLDAEFAEYYGDIFSELRKKSIIKPDDIYFLQLIIAGFSQKSVSHILDIHPKNFYTKKYRLIDKILASDIRDKDKIVELIRL